jgi:hypothetical protein
VEEVRAGLGAVVSPAFVMTDEQVRELASALRVALTW